MTEIRRQLRAITLTALLVISLFAFVGVGASSPGGAQSYVVRQGDICYDVTPLGDGTQTVSEFYDYRSPDTIPASDKFASFGTTDLQENQVSNLFLYNGSEGVSLVVLHDRLDDGPHGSTVTFNFSGLPTSREWVVEDDAYTGRDDNFTHNATSSTINWKWVANRTDGAAVRGLEDTAGYTAIEIDPGFNEEATDWGEWSESGSDDTKMDAWKLITAPDATDPSEKSVLAMDTNVTIEQGTCPDTTDPTAGIEAPSTVLNNSTFEVNGSTSTDDTGIVSYEWEFGDGTSKTGVSASHSYPDTGTYTINLTVTDAAGNNNTTSTTVTVVDDDTQPPSASLSAPAQATVGSQIPLDASGSDDDVRIVSYEWDFDSDGTIDRTGSAPIVDHAYQSAGTYETSVTVVDSSGKNDTANATISVTEPASDEPPNAAFNVPSKVHVQSNFTADASASSDDGTIQSYEWDFTGDGSIDATGKNITFQYDNTGGGTFSVTLTVTDDAGQQDTATKPIAVTDNEPYIKVRSYPNSGYVHAGDQMWLSARPSSDDDGIVKYFFEFGDGENTTTHKGDGQPFKVGHVYDEPGTYNASVTIWDTNGQTNQTNVTIVATEPDTGGGGDGGGDDGNDGNDDTTGGDDNGWSGISSTDDSDDTVTVELSGEIDSVESLGTLSVGLGAGNHLDLSVDATNNAPDGVNGPVTENDHVEPLGYLAVQSSDDLETVEEATFSFAVKRSVLERLDTSARDLQVYRWTGGDWIAVETSVIEKTDETVTFQASGAGISTFVLGVDRPNVKLSGLSVSNDAVSPGETVEITANLANDGRANEVFTVTLGLDGETISARDLTLAAGRERSITFSRAFEKPGSHTISVNGEKVEVVVKSETTTVEHQTTESASTSTETTTSPTGQTGFGMVLALLAMIGAALLANKQR